MFVHFIYTPLDDTFWHYRLGNGVPIDVQLSSLDFSKVRKKDFKKATQFHQGCPLLYIIFDQKYYTNPSQAVIYGTLEVVLISPNTIMVLPNVYDFDIKFIPTMNE